MRSARYQGDEMSVSLSQLGPEDLIAVRQLYQALQRAQQALAAVAAGGLPSVEVADEIAGLPLWRQMLDAARQLDARKGRYSEAVARAIHDLRGGSLVALIGTAQMLPFSPSLQVDLERCACFARDHQKIIRNCLPEIDPAAEAHDRETRAHDIGLIVQKWAGSEFKLNEVSRKIRFSCTFRGTLSERCREFSAIDRVVYNLVNNASAHTADGEVELAISGWPAAGPSHVRFVVSNAINPPDAERILALCRGRVENLMVGGFSTTGGGMGLRICAEFVCHAYGLRSVEMMLKGGYAGTRIYDGAFVSWFHWPASG